MATSPQNPYVVTRDGGPAPMYTFPEGSTQSYSCGQLVTLSSGAVVVVADSGTSILGIAGDDASGTASTDAPVQVVTATDRVVFTCYDESEGAETSASNFTAGLTYDLEEVSGVHYAEVDSEHATSEELIFVQPVYDVNGDSTTRGVFMFEPKALVMGPKD